MTPNRNYEWKVWKYPTARNPYLSPYDLFFRIDHHHPDKIPHPHHAVTTTHRIIVSPCETEDETLGYRCSCSFQMIQEDNQTRLFKYALRSKHTPVILNSAPYLPIALPQKQNLMNVFLHNVLNRTAIATAF